MVTWADRLLALVHKLGRVPTLDEMIDESRHHTMTPEEVDAQRRSFARGFAPCEHGVADFEDCAECMPRRHARYNHDHR